MYRKISSAFKMLKYVGSLRDWKENYHPIRVATYSEIVAEQHPDFNKDLGTFKLAAALHDLGKVSVDKELLIKNDKLELHEIEAIKKHPQLGHDILSSLCKKEPFITASKISLTHHEKWDGTGYPNGLKGNEIPLESRIVAIADVFDALMSKRPYKDAWTKEQVRDFCMEEKGRYFDPGVLDIFCDNIDTVFKIHDSWESKYKDLSSIEIWYKFIDSSISDRM
jgi:putative two-component system response regulator